MTVSTDDEGRLHLESPFCAAGDPVPRPCDDRVELVGGGGFVHLGRIDDVVKIAGKRLSLRELERRLLAVPGVSDAAVLAHDAPDGRGQRVRAAAVAEGVSAESIREQLLEYFDPTVLPRKIVLAPALPRESTGKLPRAALEALFEPPLTTVEVIDAGADGDVAWSARVRIPASLYYFRGHFPLEPVLPGVAQLEALVLTQVREAWPELVALRKVLRLKFKQKIRPDDELRVLLRRSDDRVDFQVLRAADTCSEGALVFVT